MFHQMPNEREVFNAFLYLGKSRTVHGFELPYGQLARLYALIASLADVAAIFGYMLYAEQVAERLPVEADIYHHAIPQSVSKKPIA